ncbi:MAG TPA: FHA domain-containing protein [Ktedonobacteraceae bacterium]|nr:FHA domain-containing protein [Ktedonobacteraceae bacterium]
MEANLNGPMGRIDLRSNVLTIGRAPDNQLPLQDQQASSHHAEIRPDPQGYLLVDMNSRNGTFVNEQRLMPQTPRLLISSDMIRIGETRLTYEIAGADEATVRANSADYANPGYSPTVAVPPSQSDYMNYQQPAPSPSSFQQPPPAYSNYQQPPSAPNYPQANQPAYGQPPQQQPYPTPSYPQQPQGYPQQAPWAGAPGQFGAPPAAPAAPPKKRRTGLVIGIIILLLIVVGGGIGGFLYINRSTPEKTLSAYCTALQNSDAQGAFNLLSARAQGQTSVANFTKAFQLIKTPAVGGIKSCTFTNVQQSGNNATADVTVVAGNPAIPSKPGKAFLVDENGSWKVDESPQTTP